MQIYVYIYTSFQQSARQFSVGTLLGESSESLSQAGCFQDPFAVMHMLSCFIKGRRYLASRVRKTKRQENVPESCRKKKEKDIGTQ